jgi:hypothetical protein
MPPHLSSPTTALHLRPISLNPLKLRLTFTFPRPPHIPAVPISVSTSRSTNLPSLKALAYLSMAASTISNPSLCFDKTVDVLHGV